MGYTKFDPDDNFFFHKGMSKRVAETGSSWPHYHSLFEIYFILEGNCTYFIDSKVYDVKAGDIIIIPDGVIHHTKYDNRKHSRILINCNSSFVPLSVQSAISEIGYLYRNPAIVEEAHGIFRKIQEEYNKKDLLTDEIISCYTHSLFYLLLRNKDNCFNVEMKNKVIEQAVNYVQENFNLTVTLADTAERFSVSPEHFSRMFKKETGFGFCKYLNSVRLQHAEKILRETDRPNITKIAAECGFDDSNYFSKKFKEMYGVSPKKMSNNN